MKNKEIVKVIFVINGKYVEDKEEYTIEEFKEIKPNLKNPTYLNNLIRKYLSKNNITIGNNKLSYICPDCANMLRCPKVMNRDKKSIKAYPFITNGAQIVCINEFEREEYKIALAEYRKRLDSGDESVLKDLGILERLNSNGIEVPSISVFECKCYKDDKEIALENRAKDREIKKQEKAKKFVEEQELEKALAKDPVNVLRRKKKGKKTETPKIPNLSKFFDN